MATSHYESDSSLAPLASATVAVIGYGFLDEAPAPAAEEPTAEEPARPAS